MDLVRYRKVAASATRCAAENGYDFILRMLLDAGVDINGRDDAESPMLGALCHGKDHILKTLLAYGARELGPSRCQFAEEFRKWDND